jgi:F0F1-type ATP synthase assembly protein I
MKPPSKDNWTTYISLPFEMAVLIALFAFAGFKVDQFFHCKVPWFTLFLTLLGVFLALYQVFRKLKKNDKNDDVQ